VYLSCYSFHAASLWLLTSRAFDVQLKKTGALIGDFYYSDSSAKLSRCLIAALSKSLASRLK